MYWPFFGILHVGMYLLLQRLEKANFLELQIEFKVETISRYFD